jgi:hypothetical protein
LSSRLELELIEDVRIECGSCCWRRRQQVEVGSSWPRTRGNDASQHQRTVVIARRARKWGCGGVRSKLSTHTSSIEGVQTRCATRCEEDLRSVSVDRLSASTKASSRANSAARFPAPRRVRAASLRLAARRAATSSCCRWARCSPRRRLGSASFWAPRRRASARRAAWRRPR